METSGQGELLLRELLYTVPTVGRRNYFNGHLMNDFFYFSLWALTELLQVVCDDSALTRLRKRVTILVRATDLEISDRAQSHGFFSPAV